MKIVRDGKEIELTDAEIEKVYRERETYYYVKHVKMHWQNQYEEEFPYGDNEAKAIVERAKNIMRKNIKYWDGYWDNFNLAIEEFKEEKE